MSDTDITGNDTPLTTNIHDGPQGGVTINVTILPAPLPRVITEGKDPPAPPAQPVVLNINIVMGKDPPAPPVPHVVGGAGQATLGKDPPAPPMQPQGLKGSVLGKDPPAPPAPHVVGGAGPATLGKDPPAPPSSQ